MKTRFICKIFGHKWDTSGKHEQDCTRSGCSAWRAFYVKKYHKFGEPASGWKIFDFDSISFKKL